MSWIENIIAQIEINNFFSVLLTFLNKKGSRYKKFPDSLWENIMQQNFTNFINYFVSENSYESLELLIKRFDIADLEDSLSRNQKLEMRFVSILDKNIGLL